MRSYDLGVNSFITKPVTFDGLVEAMSVFTQYWFEIVALPSRTPPCLTEDARSPPRAAGRRRRRGLPVHTRAVRRDPGACPPRAVLGTRLPRGARRQRGGSSTTSASSTIGSAGAENGIDLARELIADGQQDARHPAHRTKRPRDRRARRELGAADFLVKGEVSAATLERTIRYAIQNHAALRALQDSYRTTVRALAAALELRDDQTGAHATRVTELALRLTEHVAPDLANDPSSSTASSYTTSARSACPTRSCSSPASSTARARA